MDPLQKKALIGAALTAGVAFLQCAFDFVTAIKVFFV